MDSSSIPTPEETRVSWMYSWTWLRRRMPRSARCSNPHLLLHPRQHICGRYDVLKLCRRGLLSDLAQSNDCRTPDRIGHDKRNYISQRLIYAVRVRYLCGSICALERASYISK